jgi:hypothetical protein
LHLTFNIVDIAVDYYEVIAIVFERAKDEYKSLNHQTVLENLV